MTDPACRVWHEALVDVVLERRSLDDLPAFADHLRDCEACREELRTLTPIAGSLADPGIEPSVPSPELPPDLGPRIADQIRSEKRTRRTRRAMAAIGTVAAVSAIVFGLAVVLDDSADGPSAAVEPDLVVTLDGAHTSGTVDLVRKGWGTEIRLVAEGLPLGEVFEVWLVSALGERVSAGSFSGVAAPVIRVTLASSMDLDNATRLWVTDTTGETVLTAPL